MPENRAIFLDRDGVLNKEVNYLSDPAEFEFLEGSIEALKMLKTKGYLLIVITNQSGIARGYFTVKTLNKIHEKMERILKTHGIQLDDIYYCPHHPEFTGPCECRKPKPGMLLEARKKHDLNLKKSYLVGDTLSDIEAGNMAYCTTALVLTGHGSGEKAKIGEIKPDCIYDNLLEFAKNI
ncbi:MAG: D-glycero-beta-D-manno-heptose 1,7-bisphosphate 7-phosphatase [Promethearchaeia archaeon]